MTTGDGRYCQPFLFLLICMLLGATWQFSLAVHNTCVAQGNLAVLEAKAVSSRGMIVWKKMAFLVMYGTVAWANS